MPKTPTRAGAQYLLEQLPDSCVAAAFHALSLLEDGAYSESTPDKVTISYDPIEPLKIYVYSRGWHGSDVVVAGSRAEAERRFLAMYPKAQPEPILRNVAEYAITDDVELGSE